MKRLLIFVLTFAMALLAMSISAQTRSVDADGVKVVCVADGDKLDKHLKGDDKKAIRKLVIKDDPMNPYHAFYNNESGYWSKSFTKDFFNVLKKLPNLEEIDASESAGASCELARNYSDVTLNVRKITLKPEKNFIRVYGGESGDESSTVHIINGYLEICKNFNPERRSDIHMMNIRSNMYPQLEEYVLAGLIKFSDSNIPDSLYVNKPQRNGLIPIIIPKEGKLCFSSANNHPNLKYNLIVDNNTPISEKDMEGVYFTDDGFLCGIQQDTYVIPSSVHYIVESRAINRIVN